MTAGEEMQLCRDVDVDRIRLSRGKPLCAANVGLWNEAPILVTGLPLLQLVAPAGDNEGLMRCAFGATNSKFKSTSISLCIDGVADVSFFDRLDAHLKRELTRPEIGDLTEEQVAAAYSPIYKRHDDDASLPGHVGVKVDAHGFAPTEVYPIVEWGGDSLRHRAVPPPETTATEEKLALFQKDSQVVAAVVRLSSIRVTLDKKTGQLRLYPNLTLLRVAVYLPERDAGDEDPFA